MRKHPVERESIIIGRSGFSGLSLVHGWQHQVRSGVESVGWVWHGVYKFLHFRNASFGKVTDGFSFILNEFKDLVAECSHFCFSSVLDHEVFFNASSTVDIDTFVRGVHLHCRGTSSEITFKEIAFLRIICQSHSVAS
jgi:hypothetical protein